MSSIGGILAKNLRTFREQKKLSLDGVAKITGVSKTMLGQIERGESNPSINTVWKIANGLKLSLTSLIKDPQPQTFVVTKEEIEVVHDDTGKYKIYPFFPFEDGRRFEVFAIEIEKGGYLSADPHDTGTEEFIIVFDGELTIRTNDEEYTLKRGHSIRFKADSPHVYHNSGDTVTRISMIMHYPAN